MPAEQPHRFTQPLWTQLVPAVALAIAATAGIWNSAVAQPLLVLTVLGGVFASVHHAEVIAHRVGEPYGSLVLAIAITVIEVALIVAMMLQGGETASTLARDTVFATAMIILNGIVGLCLLLGASRHGEQQVVRQGMAVSLVCLAAIIVLTLLLPNYTTSVPGPFYSSAQLVFVAMASLVIYGTYVFVQSVRHREYFLQNHDDDSATPAPLPSAQQCWLSLLQLLLSLTTVVLSAKLLSPSLERMISAIGAPLGLLGILVASLVLMPEAAASLRAARSNKLQTAMNLAFGSALATIGLTIPVVSMLSLWLDIPLALGIDPKSTILLCLSLFIASLSFGTGRTTILQGVVHLVIFATYLFTTLAP